MGKKVLLVDDVSMFIELEKDFLQSSAVRILTARDGRQALDICRAERPSLVFMDLHMPNMNGAECCKAIKQDPELSSTPVVLITSEGKDADKFTCLSAGCDHFLTKPLDRQVFLAAARKLLPAIDRSERRMACRLRAKFRVFGITLSGLLLNLSHNGAYLATDHELEKGATVELIFALPEPNGAIIQTTARVAWLNTKKSRNKPTLSEGVGLEFQGTPDEAAKKLSRFIESNLSFT